MGMNQIRETIAEVFEDVATPWKPVLSAEESELA